MAGSKISLSEQVKALEDTVSHHRTYVRSVEKLVAENLRPKEILEDTKARLPKMEAALTTMKWLLVNEKKIKDAMG